MSSGRYTVVFCMPYTVPYVHASSTEAPVDLELKG